MHHISFRVSYLALALIAATVALPACAPKSPEEKVAWLRSLYKARLNGFIVQEDPLAEEEMELLAETEMEEPAADSEEGEDWVEAMPVAQKLMLDILIQHDSAERLPGLTVDISMVDPSEQEKGHWRVWLDTSKIFKATPTQFTHVLEGVAYEEGDGFFVEVRHPVPPEERSEYREFPST